MLCWEGSVGQDVFFGFVHQLSEPREATSEAIGHFAPLLVGANYIGLGENRADGRSHHLLGTLWNQGKGVSHEVHPAALPRGVLQDRFDGSL
jgi:hypothetical protein